MCKEPYVPQPIDTSAVELSQDILDLAELLARNTHEVYVEARLKEGWSYGAKRDDIKKTNPTLVPYEQLSYAEQDYDRRTSLETLRVILSLGYKLVKDEDS